MTEDIETLKLKAALFDELVQDDWFVGVMSRTKLGDRILATQKPKRWPIEMSHGGYCVHFDGTFLTCTATGLPKATMANVPDMDRLCVAWLEERGVDTEYLHRSLAATCLELSEGHGADPQSFEDLSSLKIAFKAILDNAKGQA